jgi:hypothetical protein
MTMIGLGGLRADGSGDVSEHGQVARASAEALPGTGTAHAWLDRIPETLPDTVFHPEERLAVLETLRAFEAALKDQVPEANAVEQAILDAFVLPGVHTAIRAIQLAENGRKAASKVRDALVSARGLLSGSKSWLRYMSDRAGDIAASQWLVLMSHADSALSLIDRLLGLA